MSPELVARLRSATPGASSVHHLNNAGAALTSRATLEAVIGHLAFESEIGGYEAAEEVQDALAAVYASVGRLVGVEASRVALAESATAAWNKAVYGYPWQTGDRVLISRAMYSSAAIALRQLADHHGLVIGLVRDDAYGAIDLDDLRAQLRQGAAMVMLCHVPTSGGLVNPAAEVGELCAERGVFYALDACQSVGQLPVSLGELGADIVTATGRKYLRAPRGTGFLALSDRAFEVLMPPTLDVGAASWESDEGAYELRDDARRFEAWEASIAGRLGLGAAVDQALALGLEAIASQVQTLAEDLRQQLESIGAEIHDQGSVKSGLVTFSIPGVPAAQVKAQLRARRVNVSVVSAASSRLDLLHRGLPDLVRASPHVYNDQSDLAAACETLLKKTISSTR